ncbi:alpha-glucan family phosphorylase [Nitriliruptor alkaliphilus]|uniref:alpha-glucan family phosphorylase n=1 Tax=Nitriliruptor alkaliphilus TaxID=427918 RepID=UPI0006977CF2|nr:alpha-glucan family phosphorylase [Nitriliruptor alkaliphilus]
MHDPALLLSDLRRLAFDLRWSWDEATESLFEELDPLGWQRTGRDPAALLDGLDEGRLAAAVVHPTFADRAAAAVADREAYLADSDTWYARSGAAPDRTIAYLSAEFALADCLRIYSGGLGALAGDHLRSASDLGVPLVAVGLAYRDGYFRQHLDASGWQQASPATNDFTRMPVRPIEVDGARLRVPVELGDGTVQVEAWEVRVGRVRLLLLDTDVPGNTHHHRAITGQLYGGDSDTRLRQELVLGVGSVRLLAALGIAPDTYHLNEGHAAFAAIERLRVHLDAGADLEAAVEQVRGELVFTTHTPVAAGHDTFDHGAAAWHLTPLAERAGIGFEQLWPLAVDQDGRWSQTVLAVRTSRSTNGVARLHGEVSRRMLAPVWGDDRDTASVPIGHVTNGVHPGRWVGRELQALYDWYLGAHWRTTVDPTVWRRIYEVDPAELWRVHTAARHRLIAAARERLAAQARRVGGGPDGSGLDPDVLTLGFARRFATYKRATLLAHDVDALAAILGDEDRPVQLLLAGKAHPRDEAGKHLIQRLVQLSRDPRFRGRIAFLEGYDLDLARLLVAGVDVWLNTPLRPFEASGTSGMKAAANGVLNASILDGWWDEAVTDHAPSARVGFGWVIGDQDESDDLERRATSDATALYRVLTEDVIATFHDRDEDGVPQRWAAMMQDAIALLAPSYSTHRMVVDYVTGVYGPGPVVADQGSTSR